MNIPSALADGTNVPALVWLYANKREVELCTKIVIVSGNLVLSHDGIWTATHFRNYQAADREAVVLSEWAEAADMELSTGPLTFTVPLTATASERVNQLIAKGTGALLVEGVGFVDMTVAVTQAGMETIRLSQYHRVP